eukprot:scaffold38353_cov31-Tisochrysis_lutea.AAC.2
MKRCASGWLRRERRRTHQEVCTSCCFGEGVKTGELVLGEGLGREEEKGARMRVIDDCLYRRGRLLDPFGCERGAHRRAQHRLRQRHSAGQLGRPYRAQDELTLVPGLRA